MKLHRKTKRTETGDPQFPLASARPAPAPNIKMGAGDILEESRGVRGDTIRGAAGIGHEKKGPGFSLSSVSLLG